MEKWFMAPHYSRLIADLLEQFRWCIKSELLSLSSVEATLTEVF